MAGRDGSARELWSVLRCPLEGLRTQGVAFVDRQVSVAQQAQTVQVDAAHQGRIRPGESVVVTLDASQCGLGHPWLHLTLGQVRNTLAEILPLMSVQPAEDQERGNGKGAEGGSNDVDLVEGVERGVHLIGVEGQEDRDEILQVGRGAWALVMLGRSGKRSR